MNVICRQRRSVHTDAFTKLVCECLKLTEMSPSTVSIIAEEGRITLYSLVPSSWRYPLVFARQQHSSPYALTCTFLLSLFPLRSYYDLKRAWTLSYQVLAPRVFSINNSTITHWEGCHVSWMLKNTKCLPNLFCVDLCRLRHLRYHLYRVVELQHMLAEDNAV